MDNTGKEKIAENAYPLFLALLVAKPVFDLGFLHICGGAKFCRMQCKYRQAGSQIEIPIHYVPGAFVCLVYLVPKEQIDNDPDTYALYCFFPNDIQQWNKRSDNYVLSLPSFETCDERFKDNSFSDDIFDRLCRLIQESTVQDEMGMLDFSNPNNSGLISILF